MKKEKQPNPKPQHFLNKNQSFSRLGELVESGNTSDKNISVTFLAPKLDYQVTVLKRAEVYIPKPPTTYNSCKTQDVL